jgi:hypothetical protein
VALGAVGNALPEVDSADREVPAWFWWWAPNVPRDVARTLPSPPWADMETNYVAETPAQLAEMAEWRRQRPSHGGWCSDTAMSATPLGSHHWVDVAAAIALV